MVTYNSRVFLAAAAEQQCLIGMLMRGGRRHHEPNYGAISVCVEGTAGFDDEGGGRLSVDGRGRDGLNSR